MTHSRGHLTPQEDFGRYLQRYTKVTVCYRQFADQYYTSLYMQLFEIDSKQQMDSQKVNGNSQKVVCGCNKGTRCQGWIESEPIKYQRRYRPNEGRKKHNTE